MLSHSLFPCPLACRVTTASRHHHSQRLSSAPGHCTASCPSLAAAPTGKSSSQLHTHPPQGIISKQRALSLRHPPNPLHSWVSKIAYVAIGQQNSTPPPNTIILRLCFIYLQTSLYIQTCFTQTKSGISYSDTVYNWLLLQTSEADLKVKNTNPHRRSIPNTSWPPYFRPS